MSEKSKRLHSCSCLAPATVPASSFLESSCEKVHDCWWQPTREKPSFLGHAALALAAASLERRRIRRERNNAIAASFFPSFFPPQRELVVMKTSSYQGQDKKHALPFNCELARTSFWYFFLRYGVSFLHGHFLHLRTCAERRMRLNEELCA